MSLWGNFRLAPSGDAGELFGVLDWRVVAELHGKSVTSNDYGASQIENGSQPLSEVPGAPL